MPKSSPTQGGKPGSPIPILHVEGPGDVSFFSGLLARHGVETDGGDRYLKIVHRGGVKNLLASISVAVKTSTIAPVGFVLDIDTALEDRWKAVRSCLEGIGVKPPVECPADGYIAKLEGYPFSFGVWLMPDCRMGGGKLEHFVERLVPSGHPLWAFAKECVAAAVVRVDDANRQLAPESVPWKCFTDADRIKAEIRTWLAWQPDPGAPLGTAIRDRLLNHDSAEALAFLRWLRRLYPGLPREEVTTSNS